MQKDIDRRYKITPNPPPPEIWEDYQKRSYFEYMNLLEDNNNDEKVFQKFFEENPTYLAGSCGCLGTTYMDSLITEPEIDNIIFRRKPDFVFLTYNSKVFKPIFIEIESPNKRLFKKNGDQTADFSQAINQIAEWKAILQQTLKRDAFYEFFSIPDRLRSSKSKFEPQFCLIYGRRAEFENDPHLRLKRPELVPAGVELMSYDRLIPNQNYLYSNFLCCKVTQGKYHVVTVPSTYQYNPSWTEALPKVNGFCDAVLKMKNVTEERKQFLCERYDYWCDFELKGGKGIVNPYDKE